MASQRRSARQQSREPDAVAPPPVPSGRGRGSRNTKPERSRTVDSSLAPLVAFNNDEPMAVIAEEAAVPANDAAMQSQEMDILDQPIKPTSPRSTWSEAMERQVLDKPHLKLSELHSRAHTLLHKLVNKPQTEEDLELLVQAVDQSSLAHNPTLLENISNFHSTLEGYKQANYIIPKVVVKATLPGSTEIAQGSWRPDPVLQKANLAALAEDLIPTPSRRGAEEVLEIIDTTFPEYFVESYQWPKGKNIPLPVGTSRKSESGFDFLLESRTQLAICRLEKMQSGADYRGMSTTDVVRRTFVDENNKPRSGAVNFMPRNPLSSMQLTNTEDRLEAILGFSTAEGLPDVDRLSNAFSFTQFKLNIVRPWIQSRNEEVESQINASGGVDVIADEWETYVAKSIATNSMQTAAAPRAPAVTNRAKPRRTRPGAAKEEGQTARVKPRGYVDQSVPVDPQLQANREQSELQSQFTQGAKRARSLQDVDGTYDPSQDTGFETDNRGLSIAEQRRQHIAHMGLQQTEHVDPSMGQQPFTPEMTSMTPAEHYKSVQEKSRSMTAFTARNKLPQQRKTWELDEINALLEGVAIRNAAYASIKREDAKGPNFLHERDAESLRHKARNMKFDYLKSGTPLPDGFDHVLLDQKFRKKLLALNIPYVQQQARRKPPPPPAPAGPAAGEVTKADETKGPDETRGL